MNFSCSDLPDVGLLLVPPSSPDFPALIKELQQTASAPASESVPSFAAVLINHTGQTIIGLTYIWKCSDANGRLLGTSTLTPLASSRETDLLTGREPVPHSPGPNMILAGSKRLIRPEGICGNNSDVAPLQTPACEERSCAISWGPALPNDLPESARVHLQLDSIFFLNGLCVGSDEARTFDALMSGVQPQRELARRLREKLALGASKAQLLDTLRPFEQIRTPYGDARFHQDGLVRGFAAMTIGHVLHRSEGELITWIESFCALPKLNLRRASI